MPQHGRVMHQPTQQQPPSTVTSFIDVQGFFRLDFSLLTFVSPPEINGDDNGEGMWRCSDRGIPKKVRSCGHAAKDR